jgi:hypothetical protein
MLERPIRLELMDKVAKSVLAGAKAAIDRGFYTPRHDDLALMVARHDTQCLHDRANGCLVAVGCLVGDPDTHGLNLLPTRRSDQILL